MILAQWKTILPVALVAAGVVATGVGARAYQGAGERPRHRSIPAPMAPAAAPEPDSDKAAAAPAEDGGKAGASAEAPRDLAAERVRLARRAFQQALKAEGLPDVDRLHTWSLRILEGQEPGVGQRGPEWIEASRQHVDRMKAVERAVRDWAIKHDVNRQDSGLSFTAAAYYRTEAEAMLQEFQAEAAHQGAGPDASVAAAPASAPKAAAPRPAVPAEKPKDRATGLGSVDTKKGTPGAKGYQPGGKDPRSTAILEKLDDPIDMPFENETPLSEVVKFIKNATSAGPRDPGIPIYVDPLGLQEEDKTMESTVRLNLQGVPLRTTLRLLLSQLDLEYAVEDGVLIISSPDLLAELRSRQGPQFEYHDYERRRQAEQMEQERNRKANPGGFGGAGKAGGIQ